jgi:hypothetical protein
MVAATLPLVPGVTDLGIDPARAGQALHVAVLDRLATDLVATFGERIPRMDLPPGFLPATDLATIAAGFGVDLAVVERILRQAPIDAGTPRRPDTPRLESSFTTLAANPALLDHLRTELGRHVRALATSSGLDPDTATFDPTFAPTTIADLYRGAP